MPGAIGQGIAGGRGLADPANQYFSGTVFTRMNTSTAGAFTIAVTEKAPGACTDDLAGGGAGNVDNGLHSYKITFVTADGETEGGTTSGGVTVADKTVDGKVALTAIPTGSAKVTSRKIYRTIAGDTGSHLLVATIADNSTTTYTDNIADSSLGAAVPTGNTAIGTWITLANSGLVTLAGGLTVTGVATFSSTVTASNTITTSVQAALVIGPYGAAAGNTGEIRWLELAAGGTNYVGFKAPDALAGNTVYTWPDAFPGSNKVLQSTSAGVLTWETVSSGANTALSNLASVAINTTLVSDTDSTDDLGTTAVHWANLYADTGIFSGASDTVGSSIDAANGVRLGSGKMIAFSSTTAFDGTADAVIGRSAAGVIGLYNETTFTTGSSLRLASDKVIQFSSTTDPDGMVDASFGRSAAGVFALYGGTGTAIGSSLALASDMVVRFSSTTDPDAAADASVFRAAANVVGVGTGASTLGALRTAAGSSGAVALQISAANTGLYLTGSTIVCQNGAATYPFGTSATRFGIPSNSFFSFSGDSDPTNAQSAAFGLSAAAVIGLYGASASVGSSLTLASGMHLQFSSTTDPDGTYDTTVYRAAAGVTGFGGTSDTAAAGTQPAQSANGCNIQVLTASELVTIAAAATTDTSALIPAEAVVLAVSTRVTTVIPTAATFDIGIAGATTRYGTGISTAANTTSKGTLDGVRYYAAGTALRITPNATPADNSGRLRVTVTYYVLTAPTS